MTLDTVQFSESLVVHFRYAEKLREEAISCCAIDLSLRQLCDLELLLNRGFYPLQGYLNRKEYESVLDSMRLTDGTVWPIPICLDVDEKTASRLNPGDRVALNDQEGFLLAILTVSDVWKPDKKKEALAIYETTSSQKHPGVANLFNGVKEYYIGGDIEGVSLPVHYDFQQLRHTPSITARNFSMNGWRRVLGFHTDEYLHCAHREMLMVAAREVGAAIFLQPVVGLDHPGNLDYYTQIRCYQKFVQHLPANMIQLSLTPFATRFAGPKEALLQAIMRKNFGCSHFVVAPDHADPYRNGSMKNLFYRVGAAQNLVKKMADETGVAMVAQAPMGYMEESGEYVVLRDGKKSNAAVITSGELHRKLVSGEDVPAWFSYPEVVEELRYAFPPKEKQGFTIFMTGLSGSGKSTIAKVLLVKFMEMRDRPVTLLDGDIVRKNLSSELTFSKEHRDLNVTRIGFVASEITKNGGIALCAPIAPYEGPRFVNRELISQYGGYIEVHVSTPLEVCELRDRKGLYAKARAGLVKGVTGVTDPYNAPENPDITIDTTNISPMEAVQEILLYLEEQGYIA